MKPFLFAALLCLPCLTFGVEKTVPTTLYRFTPDFPKYVTAHVEIRDPSEIRWPSFFYGKPVTSGTVNVDAANPSASFVLGCDQRPQKNGDQSRRVMGEVFSGAEKGGVTLKITGLNSIRPGEKGALLGTFVGTMEVNGRTVQFSAPGTLRPHPAGKGDEKNESLMIDLEFETKAEALGLKTFSPDAPIRVNASTTAYEATSATARKLPAVN